MNDNNTTILSLRLEPSPIQADLLERLVFDSPDLDLDTLSLVDGILHFQADGEDLAVPVKHGKHIRQLHHPQSARLIKRPNAFYADVAVQLGE